MDIMEDLLKEPFGPDIARLLCAEPGMFEQERLYKRIEIIKKLHDEFVNRGGNESTRKDNVALVLKKLLSGPDSPFLRVIRGRYRFCGQGGASEEVTASETQNDAERDAPTPDLDFGTGPCEVYAWCLPQYQTTSRSHWPIKIGKAGPDGLTRRLQDFQENLPERPRYLLRLRCADEGEARQRESLLHAWFKSRKQHMNDLPGKEWFLTNPNEIVEAVRNIIGAGVVSANVRAPEIEDVIAKAFRDVTAGDRARLPEDLTERLDYYLYEDDRT